VLKVARAKGRSQPERGQALAELALILPVLLVLVLGAIDFGRLFLVGIELNQAARQGVAYAAASTANATDTAGISTAALDGVGGLSGTPAVTSTTAVDSSGGHVSTVTVSATFQTLIDWPGIPHTIAMTGSANWKVLE
jgi:Flp pilus assembly protein TadG